MNVQSNKQCSQDVRIANNERARRRRQRQRRRKRRASLSAQPNSSKPHIRSFNTENTNRSARVPNTIERLTLEHVLSPDLIKFSEAVVHPFGDGAIGAILPDRYSELVVSLTDKLEFDLTPNLFNADGDWTSETDNPGGITQLLGVFMWLQPRTLACGSVSSFVFEDTGAYFNNYTNNFRCVDNDFSSISSVSILDSYNLCFTGVWADQSVGAPAPFTYGFFDLSSTGGKVAFHYLAIEYSRFNSIRNNCDKIRMLGAGLKLWSEEAPINTGGYSIGGWITMEDIFQATRMDETTITPATPGALLNIQPSIKFAKRNPGLQGCTVRYSSLQDAEQLDFEYARIPGRLFALDAPGYVDPTTGISQSTSGDIIHGNTGYDLSVNDTAVPGDFVPCIYWAFNVNRNAAASGNNSAGSGVYTLKVSSIVHSEGAPTGTCPFQTTKVTEEVASAHIKTVLENVDDFPVAATGHSFRSFLSKAKSVVATVAKGASHFVKLMEVVSKFGH